MKPYSSWYHLQYKNSFLLFQTIAGKDDYILEVPRMVAIQTEPGQHWMVE